MRPEGCIIIKQACGGDEWNHLEDGAAEGMLHIVVAHRHQLYHDESRKGGDEEHIELELRVLEQILDLKLDDCRIE